MKKITLIIVLVLDGLVAHCQTEHHYLVFTFNRKYECEKHIHGTGDHVWIIPFDSCRDGICEKEMKPLFVDDFQLECLNDSTLCKSGVGEYPIVEYSRQDPTAWKLYKNRRMVQKQIVKSSSPRTKDAQYIYCVPIIAKCSPHAFGYNNVSVVTIDCEPQIWTGFWKKQDRALVRRILQHDFSGFDYVVSIKTPK